MKKIYFTIAIAFLALIGFEYAISANAKTYPHIEEQTQPKIETSLDGMFFDVQGVVETFGYNDSAWYMVYDDMDAGMDYEVIRISKETHDQIVKAQENRQYLTGTLKVTKPYESVEYVLEADEWEILYQSSNN